MALTLRYGIRALPAYPHEIAKMVGPGWESIVVEMCEAIFMIDPTVVVMHVREKYGTLEVTMSDYDPAIRGVIEHAYYCSSVTCEACGDAGELRQAGWWMTLCDGCYAARRASDDA